MILDAMGSKAAVEVGLYDHGAVQRQQQSVKLAGVLEPFDQLGGEHVESAVCDRPRRRGVADEDGTISKP